MLSGSPAKRHVAHSGEACNEVPIRHFIWWRASTASPAFNDLTSGTQTVVKRRIEPERSEVDAGCSGTGTIPIDGTCAP